MTSQAVLETTALTCRYGGVVAVDQLDVSLREGTWCSLIGPNGAGKTSFLNLLSGVTTSVAGKISLDERDITAASMERRAELGISRTFQNLRLMEDRSVLENVLLGHRPGASGSWRPIRRPDGSAADHAAATLARLMFRPSLALPVGALSFGDRRRVEIARALQSRPRLLLLDEPTAGLSTAEVKEFGAFAADNLRGTCTVLMVSHHFSLVREISDLVMVMQDGKLIAEGKPADIEQDGTVRRAYLG